jgi:hypothetical protein
MARREARVVVDAKGRDKGKIFVLTEMSADKAERWATRLLFALINNGAEFPENIISMGMAGIAAIGIKSLGKLPFEQAEPLLEEMFECVRIQPNVKDPNLTRILIEDDIEEVATRIYLRKELFKLHIDFFTNAEQ